jgi:hypothetical protein
VGHLDRRLASKPIMGIWETIKGQVRPTDINAKFQNLVHSSQLVLADVFADEQVAVATAFPAQFSRLCELAASHQFR